MDWNSFCSTHCLPHSSKTMCVLESKSAFLFLLFPVIKVIRASQSGKSSLKSPDNILGLTFLAFNATKRNVQIMLRSLRRELLSVDTYKEEIIQICTFANTTAPELNLNPAIHQIEQRP